MMTNQAYLDGVRKLQHLWRELFLDALQLLMRLLQGCLGLLPPLPLASKVVAAPEDVWLCRAAS